ncbi:LysR family transcriptional regulator [Pseudoroseicyclus aestuarii]|uniref:LysR family transcriptional regulator n=2 Tax=Pseudoroseicyclus aestuarii TaxID=1795041 RepID=A0A318SLL3_9RHOB|nr:LysR family transcriptional regulator [Pseudoroseicyclus aestuarii]
MMRAQAHYATNISNVQDLAIFATIVEAGSLSKAARELNLSLAMVSKRLSKLEELLGVRLIARSTRSLSTTESGQHFYEQCRDILHGIQLAERQLQSRQTEVSGTLTITSSTSFARLFLASIIYDFQVLRPQVSIRLLEDDGIVSLIDAGVDLAIRQAVLPSSSLIAVAIASDHRIVCASPGYIAKTGPLRSPDDIAAHNSIVFGMPPIVDWVLSDGKETKTVTVDWRMSTRSGDATTAAAIAGAGLVYSSTWAVRQALEEGKLVNMLPAWRSPVRSIYAVYPSRSFQTPLLSEFVKFLTKRAREYERRYRADLESLAPGLESLITELDDPALQAAAPPS